jgi:hypothetical protein
MVKDNKRFRVKRNNTNVADLVQVLDEPGFDQETIAKITGVPLRTINDIAKRRDIGLIQPSLTSCVSVRGSPAKVHLKRRH